MAQCMGQFARPLPIVGPTKHLVDDVDVGKKVGDHAVVGLALHVVEQDGTTAIEMLLDAGNLQVGINRPVRLDEIALGLEPLEGAAQIRNDFV